VPEDAMIKIVSLFKPGQILRGKRNKYPKSNLRLIILKLMPPRLYEYDYCEVVILPSFNRYSWSQFLINEHWELLK